LGIVFSVRCKSFEKRAHHFLALLSVSIRLWPILALVTAPDTYVHRDSSHGVHDMTRRSLLYLTSSRLMSLPMLLREVGLRFRFFHLDAVLP
jgi:hypothetical protein